MDNYYSWTIILYIIQGKHTAENLKSLIEEIILDYDISKDKIFLLLRDAAATMVKLARNLGVKSIDCFAHKLNLVIKNKINIKRF